LLLPLISSPSFLPPPSSLFFFHKNGGAQGVLNCAGEDRAKSALLKRHNIIVATEETTQLSMEQ